MSYQANVSVAPLFRKAVMDMPSIMSPSVMKPVSAVVLWIVPGSYNTVASASAAMRALKSADRRIFFISCLQGLRGHLYRCPKDGLKKPGFRYKPIESRSLVVLPCLFHLLLRSLNEMAIRDGTCLKRSRGAYVVSIDEFNIRCAGRGCDEPVKAEGL